MEVIRAGGRSRPSVRALAIARLIGVLYVVTGLCVAWLTLATPFVALFSARGRAFASEPAFHALGWLFALGLPATCLLLSGHRLLDFSEIPNPFRSRRGPKGITRWARRTSNRDGWRAWARREGIALRPSGAATFEPWEPL